jgi:hypothetical protein
MTTAPPLNERRHAYLGAISVDKPTRSNETFRVESKAPVVSQRDQCWRQSLNNTIHAAVTWHVPAMVGS